MRDAEKAGQARLLTVQSRPPPSLQDISAASNALLALEEGPEPCVGKQGYALLDGKSPKASESATEVETTSGTPWARRTEGRCSPLIKGAILTGLGLLLLVACLAAAHVPGGRGPEYDSVGIENAHGIQKAEVPLGTPGGGAAHVAAVMQAASNEEVFVAREHQASPTSSAAWPAAPEVPPPPSAKPAVGPAQLQAEQPQTGPWTQPPAAAVTTVPAVQAARSAMQANAAPKPAPKPAAAPALRPKPGPQVFDCTAGIANWKLGWSGAKKDVCCGKVDCTRDPMFDCHDPVSTWRRDWIPERKAYCCRVAHTGCEAPQQTESATAADHPVGPRGTHHPDPSPAAPPAAGSGGTAGGIQPCNGVAAKCPPQWWSGPTGGYFCKDNGGCRPAHVGPFQAGACRSQCKIGHAPAAAIGKPAAKHGVPAYPGDHIRLFCWSLCRVGYEMDIARRQIQKGAGIFACDDQAVLSFAPASLSNGKRSVAALVVPSVPVGRSKDGTAGNALQFMKAWDTVKADGRWRDFDWIVKVDPDAVLLPGRLRSHLNPFEGTNVYVRNCDKPMAEGTMMFGALEAISQKAMATYYAQSGSCLNTPAVPWQAWGEDLFMMRCLEHIGVGNVGDFGVIQDGVCKGVWCGSPTAAAFHPMKSVAAWENCWKQATEAR